MDETLKLKRASYNLWTFVTSKMISSFGSQVCSFAISFYILSVTGSATSFAAMLICNIIPRTVLAPFAGYVVDNFSRKKIVIIAQIVATITLFTLFGVSSLMGVEIWYFYIMTTILGICGTFSGLAFTASISNLVNRERLQQAMSLNQMSISFSAIGAPIVGGWIYGIVDLPTFILVYSIACLIAIILESTMDFKLYSTLNSVKKEKVWDSIKAGIVYLREQQIITIIIMVALFINFLFGAFEVGYSYVLIEKLKISSEAFGNTMGAFAVGTLIMSIILSKRKQFAYPLVITRRFIVLAGVFFILIPLPIIIPMSSFIQMAFYMVLMFIFGVNMALVNMPIGILMQTIVDEEYRGRVLSIMDTFATALIPLSMIIFGFLFDILPAQYIFIVNGFVIIASMMYMLRGKIMLKAHPEYRAKEKEIKEVHTA